MKFTYIMGTPFAKFISSTKSPWYQHTFSTLTWDTVCQSHKTLCWRVRALHACCILVTKLHQVYPSWWQKELISVWMFPGLLCIPWGAFSAPILLKLFCRRILW